MPFLEKIDKLFEDACQRYCVTSQRDDFHIYIPVDILNGSSKFEFLIRKGKKSKLLILSGKQPVYLTDYQIISTILSFEKNEIEWFLRQFISLYTDKGVQIKIVLDGTEFIYTGISSYPEEKTIWLLTDTSVGLSCFCSLLNFIFAKDKCWEEIGHIPGFSKKTLCKYIAIIDYYCNGRTYSKTFLEGLGYPVNQPQPSNSFKAQRAFEKHDCIEKFDISNYTC